MTLLFCRLVMVMDTLDYTNKVKAFINDTNTYQQLDADPIKATVNRINTKLKTLQDQDKLSKKIFDRFRAKDANVAKFYGLPTEHSSPNYCFPSWIVSFFISTPLDTAQQITKYYLLTTLHANCTRDLIYSTFSTFS